MEHPIVSGITKQKAIRLLKLLKEKGYPVYQPSIDDDDYGRYPNIIFDGEYFTRSSRRICARLTHEEYIHLYETKYVFIQNNRRCIRISDDGDHLVDTTQERLISLISWHGVKRIHEVMPSKK